MMVVLIEILEFQIWKLKYTTPESESSKNSVQI